MLRNVCAWITVITYTKIYWISPMHSNVTIKNVSWPHFSWATLYIPYTMTSEKRWVTDHSLTKLTALTFHTELFLTSQKCLYLPAQWTCGLCMELAWTAWKLERITAPASRVGWIDGKTERPRIWITNIYIKRSCDHSIPATVYKWPYYVLVLWTRNGSSERYGDDKQSGLYNKIKLN